jgi:hypothetical protein
MGWERKGKEREVLLFGLTKWEPGTGNLKGGGVWCVGIYIRPGKEGQIRERLL